MIPSFLKHYQNPNYNYSKCVQLNDNYNLFVAIDMYVPGYNRILQCIWFMKFPVVYRQEVNSINITSTNLKNQYIIFLLIFQKGISLTLPKRP